LFGADDVEESKISIARDGKLITVIQPAFSCGLRNK
jgi:hypothetical protein